MKCTIENENDTGPDDDELAECELRKLRAIASTAKTYFDNYLQDEAEEIECCVCGDEQHRRAIALRDALQSLTPNVQDQANAEGGSTGAQR